MPTGMSLRTQNPLVASQDPTLICKEERIVSLPFGEPLSNYGDNIECSFLLQCFFPPGVLPMIVLSCRS